MFDDDQTVALMRSMARARWAEAEENGARLLTELEEGGRPAAQEAVARIADSSDGEAQMAWALLWAIGRVAAVEQDNTRLRNAAAGIT